MMASSASRPRSAGRSISDLTTLDQLIVGVLLLFLAVFVFELMLLVPCGGWENLSTCTTPIATTGAWSAYFELDPYWAEMPAWFAAIMNIQDYVFNPFWTLSLFMYLSHRQNAVWFRTATIAVSASIITTNTVYFAAEAAHPLMDSVTFGKLVLINIWWSVGPALFILRMHGAGARAREVSP